MRRSVHRIRFHPARGETGPDGKWGPGYDPLAPSVGALVTAARVGETVESARPITCAVFVARSVEVDPAKIIEVLDHPVHTGMFHIEGVSGGARWNKRIALRRFVRSDGTHAAK